MLGTQAKCPSTVKNYFGDNVTCGCTRYITLEKKVFDSKDGYDPLAQKVMCRECGHIYLIFPALNYKEEASNVHNS